jgi:D-glycero-alpha-D-manno-heptose-7-phosphate kinase
MLKGGLESRVTNERVDGIYRAAMAAGAAGASCSALAAGGFPCFITRPEKRTAVCEALRRLIQVSIDVDDEGSRIMVYEPNRMG